jgi:hypothetical protein
MILPACCARAASGHIAAAPPSIVMNSRRLMGIPSARLRASRGYHIRGDACCASRQISTAYVGLPPSPRSPDVPACRNDHGHWPLNEFGYERRYSIWLSLGPAVVDAHILAFDVTGLVQAATECGQKRLLFFSISPTQTQSEFSITAQKQCATRRASSSLKC